MKQKTSIKTTYLHPQCQGLQTYSSHHRGWGLLQQVKWAAWDLERRLLLWPVADGLNCEVQEKGSRCLITAHLQPSSNSASLSSSSRQPEDLFLKCLCKSSDSRCFNCCCSFFIPCFEVVRRALLSKLDTVVPGGKAWRYCNMQGHFRGSGIGQAVTRIPATDGG